MRRNPPSIPHIAAGLGATAARKIRRHRARRTALYRTYDMLTLRPAQTVSIPRPLRRFRAETEAQDEGEEKACARHPPAGTISHGFGRATRLASGRSARTDSRTEGLSELGLILKHIRSYAQGSSSSASLSQPQLHRTVEVNDIFLTLLSDALLTYRFSPSQCPPAICPNGTDFL